MRIAPLPILACSLALAACGDEPAQPKTAEEVVAEAGNLVKQRPGLYTSTTELIDFEVPGLPESQAQQLRSMSAEMMGQQTSFCLTQEEVDKGLEDAVRKLGEGAGNMKCTFDSFTADGNDLDAAMTCSGEGGVNARMVMDGTVEEESSRMRLDMTSKLPQMPVGEMKVAMQVTANRTGDCP